MYAGLDARDREQSRRVHGAFDQLVRLGLDRGDVTTRHEPTVLVQLSVGAYFMLMSDWAFEANFDVRQRSREIAALLAESLEPRSGAACSS
jgi:hypothetical protein